MNTTSPVAQISRRPRLLRAALMTGIMLAMVVAGWAGLVRIGWSLPAMPSNLLLVHGPLMVCGVLAALVSLERAVAMQRAWPYAAPVLSAAGAVSLIIGLPIGLSALLLTASSAVLVAVYVIIVRVQPATFTRVMALGAGLLFAGNGLWLVGLPVFRVVPWWMGFLVFTIAGERLELGRLQRLPPIATHAFVIASVVATAGIVSSIWRPDVGVRVTGAGFAALAIWLLRYDIAHRTIRMKGLPRYVAVCLLGGHVWLAAGGALAVIIGSASSGLLYDAMLHMIFVGFVFSMIFGHAPIILPAVMGVAVAPLKQFYAPLVLLHVSLVIRIAGDAFGSFDVRRWGGMLNAVALLTFVAVMAYAVRKAARRAQSASKFKEKTNEDLTPA